MKSIDFKKHKLFLVETIFFAVIIALLIIGGIYSADKDDFSKIATLIERYNIEDISHGDFIIKSEKYFYKDTLYYQTDSELTDDQKSKITDLAYKLFDKYDFDVIESENEKVSFSYTNQSIDLVYSKSKTPHIGDEGLCKSIATNWYVVEY